MAREEIKVGEEISDSPVGPGTLTGITERGYPQVNYVAVTWLKCPDGTVYDPHGHLNKKPLVIKPIVIAIDFDGTCVKHAYPLIGDDIGAQRVLKALVDAGHELVIWTMRHGSTKMEALEWFRRNGINVSVDDDHFVKQTWTKSSKLFVNLYIDDAALGIPLIYREGERPYVDWRKVEVMLIERLLIPDTDSARMTRQGIRPETS